MAKTYGQATGRESTGKGKGTGKPFPGSSPTSIKRTQYREVDAAKVLEVIERATAGGNAVLFGVTGDGGAFAVTFFIGDVRKKVYAPSVEEFEVLLDEWIDYFTE